MYLRLHGVERMRPAELDRSGLVEALPRHAEHRAEDAHVEGGGQEQLAIAVGVGLGALDLLLRLRRRRGLAPRRPFRRADPLQDRVGEPVAAEQGLAVLSEFLLDEDHPRQVFLIASFGESCQHIIAHVALDADVRQRDAAVILAEEPPRVAVAERVAVGDAVLHAFHEKDLTGSHGHGVTPQGSERARWIHGFRVWSGRAGGPDVRSGFPQCGQVFGLGGRSWPSSA